MWRIVLHDYIHVFFVFGMILSTSYVVALPCMPPSSLTGRLSIESFSGGTLGNFWQEGIPNGARVRVSVRCDRAFFVEPPVISRCSNGSWLTPWPRCVAVRSPCTVPSDNLNVQQYVNGVEARKTTLYPASSTLPDGTVLFARCRDPGKYALIGNSQRNCSDGEWIGVEPECVWQHTQVLFYGAFRRVASNGTVVVYQQPAQHPKHLFVRCLVYRNHVQGCPQLVAPHIQNAQESRITCPSHVDLLLNPTRTEHSGNFTCTTDSSATSHTVTVLFKAVECEVPDVPANGTLHDPHTDWRRGRFPIGKKVSFSCDDGFRLEGANLIVCMMGHWSYPSPVCQVNRCPEVAIPDYAVMEGVYGYGRNIGDERIFHCRTGYILRGQTNLIRCMEGGVWSNALPTCERAREVVEQVSPCESVQCESWEKCVVTWPTSTRCSCINPFNCEAQGPEVCGTDGANYTSECHLKALACILDTGVDIAEDPAVCVNGPTEHEEAQPDRAEEEFTDPSSSSFGESDNTQNSINVRTELGEEPPRSSPGPLSPVSEGPPTIPDVLALPVVPSDNYNDTLAETPHAVESTAGTTTN